jgi:hypothetical protein
MPEPLSHSAARPFGWQKPSELRFSGQSGETAFPSLVVCQGLEVRLCFRASGSLTNLHFSSALASVSYFPNKSHDITWGWNVGIVFSLSLSLLSLSLSSFLFSSRQDPAMLPKLVSNSCSTYLDLLSTGITGVRHNLCLHLDLLRQ